MNLKDALKHVLGKVADQVIAYTNVW